MSSKNKVLTTTVQLQPEKLQYLREARNLLKRKKIVKGKFILNVGKRRMKSIDTLYHHKVCKRKLGTPLVQPVTNINHYYPCTPQVSNYPITMNEWQYLCMPLVTVIPLPVPVVTPIFPTLVTPILNSVLQPIMSPISAQPYARDHLTNIFNYTNGYNTVDFINEQSCQIQEIDPNLDPNWLNIDAGDKNAEVDENQCGVIESYLKLPKELFPTPNMLALDPNPLIDEFCKVSNLQNHIPWILDLEFGIPRSPITRPIPTFNVKFNSIHCKNTPDAIHPGFESCDPDFKKVLLFNYDCIVSAWYRGYMILHSDTSIENFQSWLLLPMQVLGMCWP